MNDTLAVIINRGFEKSFGYKIVSHGNTIVAFFYDGKFYSWREQKSGELASVDSIKLSLAAESNHGEFMVLACSCDECTREGSREAMEKFTRETGIFMSSKYFPQCAEAQIKRNEREQDKELERISKLWRKGFDDHAL